MSALHMCIACCMLTGAVWGASVSRRANCPAQYTQISPGHTMCLNNVGTPVAVSEQLKEAALDAHNNIRSAVSQTPADMMKLVWDDDLAAVASKWAAQCQVNHDEAINRALPDLPGVWVGQNVAAGTPDLVSAIEYWGSEQSNFRYGSQPVGPVGHYIQLVYGKTSRVGCGMADCPSSQFTTHYVCNYAHGQESHSDDHPYQAGQTGCDHCPTTCDTTGTLCDCSGKLCLNYGVLDLNTCTCSCPDLYTGNKCQKLVCQTDDSYCPQYIYQYGPQACALFYQVLLDCPQMCGVC